MMPNYIKNIIRFNDERDMENVIAVVSSDNILFDFNKILPIPKDLQDSFDWRVTNWSTKWNADAVICHDCQIEFLTAWSAPINILDTLSDMFPHMDFTYIWSDEAVGQNASIIQYRYGQQSESYYPDENSKDALEIYDICWNQE